jgi:zona occludens toxin
MIELITGLPGNGKTLYTISYVKAKAEKENRAVFYHGIPELTLNWQKLEDPREWMKCPPGSIIVLDEAQQTFRNRSMGAVPPEFVQALETHRHLGMDLVMITQHPSLIDPAVRRLAGAHRHMVRIWGMEASTVHQWAAVKDNCDKARADSEKTKWAFDKSVYGYYKSAEVHTMKRTIPGRVKMLGVLMLLLVLAVWQVVSFVSKKSKPPEVAHAASPAAQAAPGVAIALSPAAAPGAPGRPAPPDPMADAQAYVYKETPRVVGLPQTAPKYDELTAPTKVPVPAICIVKGDVGKGRDVSCRCMTQQATPLDVPFNMCMSFALNGYFQDFDIEAERKNSADRERSAKVLETSPVGKDPYREPETVTRMADLTEPPPTKPYQYRLTGATILK